jgi:hypothetical protein
LLGNARIVKHQDAVARGRFGAHLLHPRLLEVLLIPRHVRQERLHPLGIGARHGLGDGITVVIGQLGEQAREIALQRFPALRPSEAHLETGQKLRPLRQRRRTGLDLHRYPPVTQKDPTVHQILTE